MILISSANAGSTWVPISCGHLGPRFGSRARGSCSALEFSKAELLNAPTPRQSCSGCPPQGHLCTSPSLTLSWPPGPQDSLPGPWLATRPGPAAACEKLRPPGCSSGTTTAAGTTPHPSTPPHTPPPGCCWPLPTSPVACHPGSRPSGSRTGWCQAHASTPLGPGLLATPPQAGHTKHRGGAGLLASTSPQGWAGVGTQRGDGQLKGRPEDPSLSPHRKVAENEAQGFLLWAPRAGLRAAASHRVHPASLAHSGWHSGDHRRGTFILCGGDFQVSPGSRENSAAGSTRRALWSNGLSRQSR